MSWFGNPAIFGAWTDKRKALLAPLRVALTDILCVMYLARFGQTLQRGHSIGCRRICPSLSSVYRWNRLHDLGAFGRCRLRTPLSQRALLRRARRQLRRRGIPIMAMTTSSSMSVAGPHLVGRRTAYCRMYLCFILSFSAHAPSRVILHTRAVVVTTPYLTDFACRSTLFFDHY